MHKSWRAMALNFFANLDRLMHTFFGWSSFTNLMVPNFLDFEYVTLVMFEKVQKMRLKKIEKKIPYYEKFFVPIQRPIIDIVDNQI